MFRRLFFLLFLIGLALPSMAVPAQAEIAMPNCHGAVPAEVPRHQPDDRGSQTIGHFCIGCVANSAPSIVAAPIAMPALVPPIPPMTARAGANAPPSIPPPRP